MGILKPVMGSWNWFLGMLKIEGRVTSLEEDHDEIKEYFSDLSSDIKTVNNQVNQGALKLIEVDTVIKHHEKRLDKGTEHFEKVQKDIEDIKKGISDTNLKMVEEIGGINTSLAVLATKAEQRRATYKPGDDND